MHNYFFTFLFISLSYSQIQYGGTPKYLINTDQVSKIDIDQTKLIDNDLHPMVLQYANEYLVDINVKEVSKKITIDNKIIHYLSVKSSNAKSIGLVFSKFYLTENTELYIYSEDRSMYIGKFNNYWKDRDRPDIPNRLRLRFLLQQVDTMTAPACVRSGFQV